MREKSEVGCRKSEPEKHERITFHEKLAKFFMNKVFLLVCVLCVLRSPSAAGDEPSEKISFYKINVDQRIHFEASGWFSTGMVMFEIKVFSAPQPHAVITLRTNAAMVIDTAEKTWGHPEDMPVTKTLTEADLKYLESYLAAYRANGKAGKADEALKSHYGYKKFDLETYTPGIETGHKKENYKGRKEGDTEFIKSFVGFNPPPRF